jgi:sugar/nucleoside kinase (ribokinase family)
MPVRNLMMRKSALRNSLPVDWSQILTGSERILASGPGKDGAPACLSVKAIDSTGAGDAFIGSFAVFLAEGLAGAAARRANLYMRGLSTAGLGREVVLRTGTL